MKRFQALVLGATSLATSLLLTSAAAQGRECAGQKPTLTGTPGSDRIVGTSRADVIAGGAGNDVIIGRGGDDRICGEEGSDLVIGGPGSDVLSGDSSTRGDTVSGGAGADVLSVTGGGRRAENYLFGGNDDDDLQGSTLEGADHLFPGAGNDTIDGGDGSADELSLWFSPAPVTVDMSAMSATGEGSDSLNGIEQVQGSAFDDALAGADASETLRGEEGNDVISGLDGSDVLAGGPGDDDLDGAAGVDEANFYFSEFAIELDLTEGISSGEGTDALVEIEDAHASWFDDRLTGTNDSNSLDGDGGADQLFGLDGDDALFDGDGDAGSGDDICYYDRPANCETNVYAPHYRLDNDFDSPLQGQSLAASTVLRFHGHLESGQIRPIGADLAVRRLSAGGCKWLKDHALRVGHCHLPVWNRARWVEDTSGGEWSYQLRRPLPRGRYIGLVRGKYGPGTSSRGVVTDFRYIRFTLT